MALKKKQRRHRGTRAFRRRATGERRRTTSLVVLGGIVTVLVLGGVVGSAYLGTTPIETALRAALSGGDEEVSVARVEDPVVSDQAPEPISEEVAAEEVAAEERAVEEVAAEELAAQEAAVEAARLEAERIAAAEEEAAAAAALEAEQIIAQEEQEAAAQAALEDEPASLAEQEAAMAEEEDEVAPVAPSDSTMYLSVPKLGISGAIVAPGEAGLELGTQLVSGAPWVSGSNTYIAGHRVGFPGTGSDRIFYDLPSMTAGDTISLYDSLGQEYTYQVTEVFAVTPFDVWVMAPTGSDMVSLQVCTETPDDWWTIGPKLMSSGPESGRLIVRAVRV